MRTTQDDTSELAACNFSHQRAASPELVMRSLKHVTPDAAYWLTPDPPSPEALAPSTHTRPDLTPFRCCRTFRTLLDPPRYMR